MLQSDYCRLFEFARECERVQSFASADAQAMGVKNALSVLKLAELPKPADIEAGLKTDPDPVPENRKTK